MVHALQEVWQVLRTGSCLIDLRPAAQYATVGLVREGQVTVRWKTTESLEGYRAAGRALKAVQVAGLFRHGVSSRFTCSIVIPTVQELRDWLVDWYETEATVEADILVNRLEDAMAQPGLTGGIVAWIPFVLKVFGKRELAE